MNIKKWNMKSTGKHILLFSIMGLLILVFSVAFGKSNGIIGLSSIILTFLLLKKDISKHLLKNSTKIIIINLIIGIAAFLAWEIPELSFIIVFIILFLTCILTKDISEKIYLPFVYEFVFILAQPIAIDGLGIRLVSLIVGSLFVIVINIIFHKLKKNKSKNKEESLVDEEEVEEDNLIENNVKEDNLIENNVKEDNLIETDFIENKVKEDISKSLKEDILSKFRKNKKHYLFSIELALLIAIFEFMTIYLKIPSAKWLSYLVVTLIWPNIDLRVKSYGKIKGYINGIILFIILDLLFLNHSLINVQYLTGLIPNIGDYVIKITILISAYLYTILTLKSVTYSKRVTFSALLSLSLAYLSVPPSDFIVEKFLVILFGTLLCLGVNYLFRRSLKIEVQKR